MFRKPIKHPYSKTLTRGLSTDVWGQIFLFLQLHEVRTLLKTNRHLRTVSLAKKNIIWRMHFPLHFPEYSSADLQQLQGIDWGWFFSDTENRLYRHNVAWSSDSSLSSKEKRLIHAFKSLNTEIVLAAARKTPLQQIQHIYESDWAYLIRWSNRCGTKAHAELLKQIYAIFLPQRNEDTRPWLAATFNQVDQLQSFIAANKIQIQKIDSILHASVSWGSYDCALLLFQQFTFRRSDLADFLYNAAIHGDSRMIQTLITYGASARWREISRGLIESVALDSNHAVKLLLDHKANINFYNAEPLTLAIYRLKPRMVSLLLEYKNVALFNEYSNINARAIIKDWSPQQLDKPSFWGTAESQETRDAKKEIHALVKKAIWREPKKAAQEIALILSESYTLRITVLFFTGRHQSRAFAVQEAVIRNPDAAMKIIQNQIDLFDGKKTDPIPELLAERYSSPEQLRNIPKDKNACDFYKTLIKIRDEFEYWREELRKDEGVVKKDLVLPEDRFKGRFI